MSLATSTGISATERVPAMLKNTVYGMAVAKACGKTNPTVGILNIEGARQLEIVLPFIIRYKNRNPCLLTKSKWTFYFDKKY